MKLSIFEKNSIDETEVVINCKSRNPEIECNEINELIKERKL